MFSRLSNGKHIKRLTPEEARKENEKKQCSRSKKLILLHLKLTITKNLPILNQKKQRTTEAAPVF